MIIIEKEDFKMEFKRYNVLGDTHFVEAEVQGDIIKLITINGWFYKDVKGEVNSIRDMYKIILRDKIRLDRDELIIFDKRHKVNFRDDEKRPGTKIISVGNGPEVSVKIDNPLDEELLKIYVLHLIEEIK